MKKVLIYENSNLLSEITTDLNQFKPYLVQVKTTYEKLELGKFADVILKEITQTNINEIDKKYFEKCESDFSKLNISNAVIKENLMKGSNELFNEFLVASRNLRKFRPTTYSRSQALLAKQISFENGNFYLSDENKEQILELNCRIYLETEKEFELYDNLKQFIEAYDKVNENLNELQFTYNFSQGKGLTAIQNVFLKFTENSFEVDPGSIKYAVNYNENRMKFNS